MSGLSTGHGLMVVKATKRGMHCEQYPDELTCVKEMAANGSLGRGIDSAAIGFGSGAHRQALEQLELHIQNVRQAIFEQERLDREEAGPPA